MAGRFCCNGVTPAATGHSGCLRWRDNDNELSNTETLYVNNVRRPRVREAHLSNVEKNGLWMLAGNLSSSGSRKEARNQCPERVLRVAIWVILVEVRNTRSICGSSSKAVSESGRTCLYFSSIGKREVEEGHVLESVVSLDAGIDNGR